QADGDPQADPEADGRADRDPGPDRRAHGDTGAHGRSNRDADGDAGTDGRSHGDTDRGAVPVGIGGTLTHRDPPPPPAPPPPPPAPDPGVTRGTPTGDENHEPTADARAVVVLIEGGNSATAGTTVASTSIRDPGDKPVKFELAYPTSKIVAGGTYRLYA